MLLLRNIGETIKKLLNAGNKCWKIRSKLKAIYSLIETINSTSMIKYMTPPGIVKIYSNKLKTSKRGFALSSSD